MRSIGFILVLFLALSCDSTPAEQKAKFSVQKTADILTEIRLAKAGFQIYSNQLPENERDWAAYQAEVFERLKIEQGDFVSSLTIHSGNPDSTLVIDSLVLVNLEKKSRKEIKPGIDAHHPIKKYQGQVHKERSE